ncbi:MAG: prolyl oligopeptidase family serine peptidase [Rhizomicrobium sp.]
MAGPIGAVSARLFPRAAKAVLLSAALSIAAATHAVAGDVPRAVTIDDLLNAETLDRTEFSSDGRWLVFVREVPATQQPSWGYMDASRVRARIFVAHADGTSLHEIASRPDVRYALAPNEIWSPDGKGLLLLASRRGGYGVAYGDLATGAVTEFPGQSFYGIGAWMPDGRVVYAAMADGERPLDLESSVLDGLDKRWRGAWNGHRPQVTVSAPNPVFPTPPPPAGALMLADPHGGAAQTVARGNFSAIAASSDGRHIAAIGAAEELPDAIAGRGLRSELRIFAIDGKGAHLVRRYPGIDLPQAGSLAWSPSGGKLIFIGRPLRDAQSRPIDYGRDLHGGLRLYETDAAGAPPRPLTDADQSMADWNAKGVLPIGWLGERPIAAVAHSAADAAPSSSPVLQSHLEYGQARGTRIDVFAFDGRSRENLTSFAKSAVDQFLAPKRGQFAFVVADGALWRVQPGQGPQRISPGGAPPILGFGTESRYLDATGGAYYRGTDAERISLTTLSGSNVARLVLDLKSGTLSALSPPGTIVATAPDQLTTISRRVDGWSSTVHLNGSHDRILADLNADLRDRAVAPAEKFTFAYKGATLTGWLVTPPGTPLPHKLPAIVSIYGGSMYGDTVPIYARTDMPVPQLGAQLFAAQGYAVIYPSTPLGAGADTDMMATLAGEAVAAVDALAAKEIVDPARVGITGQSFGGFSTAAVLAERSDRFRAGVALAGIYDWVHGYGLRDMAAMLDGGSDMLAPEILMIESSQARLARPFWDSPDAYIRNSPIFRADKIDAPLLLLHGDLDMAVTGLSGAERLYNAMLRAGKTAALVRYWGEGHVAVDDWAIRDQWQRMNAWFDFYLKGAKPAAAHD